MPLVLTFVLNIAPKEIRGRLISLQQLMITVGIMLAFWVNVGTEKYDSEAQFRVPLGIQMAPALILFVGAFFLPYSPRWLMNKGREDEALDVLAALHGKGDKNHPGVIQEFQEIREQVEQDRRVSNVDYTELFNARNRRRLLLGILIQVSKNSHAYIHCLFFINTLYQR